MNKTLLRSCFVKIMKNKDKFERRVRSDALCTAAVGSFPQAIRSN